MATAFNYRSIFDLTAPVEQSTNLDFNKPEFTDWERAAGTVYIKGLSLPLKPNPRGKPEVSESNKNIVRNLFVELSCAMTQDGEHAAAEKEILIAYFNCLFRARGLIGGLFYQMALSATKLEKKELYGIDNLPGNKSVLNISAENGVLTIEETVTIKTIRMPDGTDKKDPYGKYLATGTSVRSLKLIRNPKDPEGPRIPVLDIEKAKFDLPDTLAQKIFDKRQITEKGRFELTKLIRRVKNWLMEKFNLKFSDSSTLKRYKPNFFSTISPRPSNPSSATASPRSSLSR